MSLKRQIFVSFTNFFYENCPPATPRERVERPRKVLLIPHAYNRNVIKKSTRKLLSAAFCGRTRRRDAQKYKNITLCGRHDKGVHSGQRFTGPMYNALYLLVVMEKENRKLVFFFFLPKRGRSFRRTKYPYTVLDSTNV